MQAIGTFRRELKRDQEPSDMSDDDRSCEEGEVNVDKQLFTVLQVSCQGLVLLWSADVVVRCGCRNYNKRLFTGRQ